MHALCWVSLGGNPVCAAPPPRTPTAAAAVPAGGLVVGAPLGAGASGDVFAATWVRLLGAMEGSARCCLPCAQVVKPLWYGRPAEAGRMNLKTKQVPVQLKA